MASRGDLDTAYLKMANIWAQLSRARRKKVGCLIVKDGMIISDGFNGTPKGFDNNCETQGWRRPIYDAMGDYQELQQGDPDALTTKPEVLHAESNAITKLAKSTQSSDGATMYSTCSPCVECAKLIIQAGIKRLVYGEMYKNNDGLTLLSKAAISINHNKLDT
tara:strand:- start:95 stop:583 length:489 start_codon:yes stop_codon:yes gene_type:complete